MTVEELKESDWYKERPQIIKDLIDKVNPYLFHKLHGDIVAVEAFNENGTIRIVKTGYGGVMEEMGLGMLNRGMGVFGVHPEDLTPLTQKETDEIKQKLKDESIIKDNNT